MADDFKADKELTISWLQDETTKISEMPADKEPRLAAIEARINLCKNMLFEGKARLGELFKEKDKVEGRKGISPQFRAEREKLIEDPNISVNFDKPKKEKPKTEKKDLAKDVLGLDLAAMKREIEERRKAKALEEGEKK